MSVFEPNPAYKDAQAERDLINALLADSEGVRREPYLPRNAKEDAADYLVRAKRSTLYNHFKRTVQVATGKVLSKSLSFKDGVRPEVLQWIENFDAEGTHLDQWCIPWFSGGIAQGIKFAMADMPRVEIPANGVRTLEDDRNQGIRPYAILIDRENMIGWRTERVGGVRTLVECRIREFEWVSDGKGGEKLQMRVRVLTIGGWELYIKNAEGKDELIDFGYTGLSFIPIVPFYANKTGPFEGSPPFKNLAELNIRHFQSSSEQANILAYARVPILHIARSKSFNEEGQPETEDITLSQSQAVETNVDEKLGWVEHGGKAIQAGRDDLQDLQDLMDEVSYKLAPRQTSGDITATETNVVSAEAHVFLSAMANNFKDALELLLFYMCVMADLRDGNNVHSPEVIINKDFGTTQTATDMPLLLDMHREGLLTRESVVEGAIRRGLLPEDTEVAKVIPEEEPVEVVEQSGIVPPEDSNNTQGE